VTPAQRPGRVSIGLLSLLALALGCTKEKESLILVAVKADASAGQLTTLTIEAEGVSQSYRLMGGLGTTTTTYGLYVPSRVSGGVDVNVTARVGSNCAMGYAGAGRTDANFVAGESVTVTVMLKPSNLCGMGGSGGGGGTTGAAGAGGTGGGNAGSSQGGTSGGGCTGTQPPAGTPPSLTCCTEYDHTLQGIACDTNDTYIYSVAFSPDGKRVVTGGDDGRYVFWNFDGKVLTAEGHNITGGNYGYAAFSPDGMTFAAGGGDVHLFNVTNWSEVGSLPIDYTSYGVAFTPDGQRVVDIDSDSLYVHSVATLSQATKALLPHTSWALAVSPIVAGGGLGVAVTSSAGYATVYNLTGQSTLGAAVDLPVSANGLWAAAFSPSGTQLAVGGYDSYIDIFNLPLASSSATPVVSFTVDPPAELEDVNGIAFSPNGRYVAVASGFSQGSASIWDVTTQTQVGRYPLLQRFPLSVAFSPSGNAIVVGEHGCGKFLLCTE
jgi:WD40 repeat protein